MTIIFLIKSKKICGIEICDLSLPHISKVRKMKFIENKKHRYSAMANQSEVVQSGKNDLSKDDFTRSTENATIQAVSSFKEIAIIIMVCFAVSYPILFNDFLYYWDGQWMAMNRYNIYCAFENSCLNNYC